MAHESFQDPQIATLLNESFVSIKVDREERPDIDMLYMSVCQMMTGSGGWPLTIIMTPEKEPFFAGTYIPKETRFGRQGMREFLPHVREIWSTRKSEVLDSANRIAAALHNTTVPEQGEELNETVLRLAYQELEDRFDDEYGRFGAAPKAPIPHNLRFLLRYWKRAGEPKALTMAEKTLQTMRDGGIYDQIGFGFHRYSTDQVWLVPHFEKMLYDQALLAMAYLETFQATGKEAYARTTREIFTYVLRDMTAENGGFYSAEDADSEGEEGKFYLWTHDEIKQILTPEEADFTFRVFNIKKIGNFKGEIDENQIGRNILYLTKPHEESALELKISLSEFHKCLESVRSKLFTYRDKRVHPSKDTKILTDWNGLMIGALAMGGRILDERVYTDAAKHAVDFILKKVLSADGQLLHRFHDGEAAVAGNLDDYAFLIQGLLELYETTFDVDYLKNALNLNEYLLKHFWDSKNSGFFFPSDNTEQLLVRQKNVYDGAIPSGNSIAMLNLLRLGRITADSDLEQKVSGMSRAFSGNVSRSPSAYAQLMVAVDFAVGPSYEVVVAGTPQAVDTEKMLQVINQKFIPNKIVVFLPAGPDLSRILQIAPFAKYQSTIGDKPTAYVCVNYSCKLPTTDLNTMLSSLTSG